MPNPQWNPSMRRPKGGPLSNAEANKEIFATSGAGTVKDPRIIWFWNMRLQENPRTKEEREKILLAHETERVVREQAIKLKCPFAWVLGPPHETTTKRIGFGHSARVGEPLHITARFGINPEWLLFSSHIYVKENHGSLTLNRQGGGVNPKIWVWGDYPAQWITPGSQDEN